MSLADEDAQKNSHEVFVRGEDSYKHVSIASSIKLSWELWRNLKKYEIAVQEFIGRF